MALETLSWAQTLALKSRLTGSNSGFLDWEIHGFVQNQKESDASPDVFRYILGLLGLWIPLHFYFYYQNRHRTLVYHTTSKYHFTPLPARFGFSSLLFGLNRPRSWFFVLFHQKGCFSRRNRTGWRWIWMNLGNQVATSCTRKHLRRIRHKNKTFPSPPYQLYSPFYGSKDVFYHILSPAELPFFYGGVLRCVASSCFWIAQCSDSVLCKRIVESVTMAGHFVLNAPEIEMYLEFSGFEPFLNPSWRMPGCNRPTSKFKSMRTTDCGPWRFFPEQRRAGWDLWGPRKRRGFLRDIKWGASKIWP